MNIELVDVSKNYTKKNRQISVINHFSNRFEEGKLYLFKGSSGSGKSTLLSSISLIQEIDSGEIKYDEQNVEQLSQEEKCTIRRNNVGIVFQESNLLEGLTVLENVTVLPVCEKLMKKKEAQEKALSLLGRFGIEDKEDAYPAELSGGERQRVGIARALINSPKLLVCDEPTANLDDDNAKNIVELLKSISDTEKCIVIAACHSNHFDDVADEIIRL